MKNTKLNRGAALAAGFLSLLIGLSACDSFVEVGLTDAQLASPVVFQDGATATAALTEVYSKMRDAGLLAGTDSGLSYTLGLYADELDYYGTTDTGGFQYAANGLLATSPEISDLWNATYRQVYGANAVISGLEGQTVLDESLRQQLLGEAYFLRGLLHCYLCGVFGAVPYVTSADYRTNRVIAKLPSEGVLQQAKADLETAMELLPAAYASADRTRANRFAAHALLARVCLYAGDWQGASGHASAVINETGLYGFDASLADSFLIGSAATILQFSPALPSTNSLEAITFIFEGNPGGGALSESLLQAFEPGDLRRMLWVREVADGGQARYHAYKYRMGVGAGAQTEYSKVLRLPECFLIRAEARLRQGDLTGAAEDLNVVRQQAGLADTGALSQDSLLEAVLRERRVEFFCEFGHRFFDLKRLGRLDAELSLQKPGWNATDFQYPIPQSELLLNPNLAPQNQGY